MTITRLAIAFLSFLLIVPAGQASTGEDEATLLVLESHVEARPRDATYLLDPLIDELTRHGFRSSSVTSTRIHSQHSLSSDSLSSSDRKKAQEAIRIGYQAYINGQYEGAIESCQRGIEMLLGRPATMVREQTLRDDLYKGLVVVAMTHNRLGHKEALEATMGEFLRTFPNRDISRASYGPEGVKLYQKLNKDLRTQPTGKLQIAAGADSMIFVNETHVGMGSLELELLPGRYRVYTQRGAQAGRVHLVDVDESRSRTLVVDPLLDSALRTSDFVGFVFDSEEQRSEYERRAARELGKALGAKQIVLVGFHKYKGQDSIIASMVEVERDITGSSARVPIPSDSAPSAKQLRALAAFVVGDGPASGNIEVLSTPQPQGKESPPTSGSLTLRTDNDETEGLSSAWRWSSFALGAAAIGVGAYLLSIHGEGTCELQPGQVACPEKFDTLTPGIGSLAGGAALGALGFYFWTKEADDETSPRVSVRASDDGFAFALSGRF